METLHLDHAPTYGFGRCDCCGPASRPGRRLFTGLLVAGAAAPAWAREGVQVGERSKFTKLVPAEDIEQGASLQYQRMLGEANQKRALLPGTHPQVQRLRYIAQRMLPFTAEWNPRARQWKWEVNILASKELNAFCMPAGKIAFYYGILAELQLSDDEVAAIMGHEVAHALREHARERMGKTAATRVGASVLSNLLGLGNLGDAAMNLGAQLLTLKFSREDESEADLVGMELAARAGYDPQAGVSLWKKMGQKKQSPDSRILQLLSTYASTHPAGPERIQDIQRNQPDVASLYARAPKPDRRFPPAEALKG
ncbi:M48 family metallopeptidase [Inhella gelatinilytica]|uniref:M48 family metallopeptidase n=1 Tax=Inhella gelatinilytica TaxID=2795030 RepID=A0A931IXD8_9BURK|nr:M48 family metallopeptidase [Inhella gelatinilytica]MBH9553647.1 M48 family metallopeptidase [Inhella gelatinilytica]